MGKNRRLTRKDELRIATLLTTNGEVSTDGFFYYHYDWSDARVATEVGESESGFTIDSGLVCGYRSDAFGKMRPTPQRFRPTSELEAKVNHLTDELAKALKRIDVLEQRSHIKVPEHLLASTYLKGD